MNELDTNYWSCMAGCSGVCFVACAAGVSTGPAALAIVTSSNYYINIKSLG